MTNDTTNTISRTPEEIGKICGTMSAVLNRQIGYSCLPGNWRISRSEDGTQIIFTDIALQHANNVTSDSRGIVAQPDHAGRIISADDVQPGDKIEIVIFATVTDVIGGKLDNGEISRHSLDALTTRLGATTIRLIERPKKPIAVGDRVHNKPMEEDGPFITGTVRHVEDGWASVKWDGQPGLGVSDLRYLTRAPVSSFA